jgi:hypothetical protein
MDTTQNRCGRQDVGFKSSPDAIRPVLLSPSDRRLLLISTLCLLLRRSRRGAPVTAQDLLRLIPYADPETASEMAKAAA